MFNFSKKGKIQYLIVGLGNPGSRYKNTRHNAGFIVLDKIARNESFEFKKVKFHSLTADAVFGSARCLFIKPQTMMNNSGEAVYEAASYYDIPDENILVIFDDVSLEPGKLRIRRKGSAGGHNGIKSVINCIGSENFPRIKIGVGKKPEQYDLADWVLSSFPDDVKDALGSAVESAADAAKLITDGEIEKAMNLYNS